MRFEIRAVTHDGDVIYLHFKNIKDFLNVRIDEMTNELEEL